MSSVYSSLGCKQRRERERKALSSGSEIYAREIVEHGKSSQLVLYNYVLLTEESVVGLHVAVEGNLLCPKWDLWRAGKETKELGWFRLEKTRKQGEGGWKRPDLLFWPDAMGKETAKFPHCGWQYTAQGNPVTWPGQWPVMLAEGPSRNVGCPLIPRGSRWCAKLRIPPDRRQGRAWEPSLLRLTPRHTLTHAQFWGSLVSRGCALSDVISFEWPSLLFWSLLSPSHVTDVSEARTPVGKNERRNSLLWKHWKCF